MWCEHSSVFWHCKTIIYLFLTLVTFFPFLALETIFPHLWYLATIFLLSVALENNLSSFLDVGKTIDPLLFPLENNFSLFCIEKKLYTFYLQKTIFQLFGNSKNTFIILNYRKPSIIYCLTWATGVGEAWVGPRLGQSICSTNKLWV